MDGICLAVLNKAGEHGAGKYEIISADEFFEGFPEEAPRSQDALEGAIKELRAEGYIDLKYSNGDMYCVAKLKDPLPETDTDLIDGGEEIYSEKSDKLPVFWAAFAGGALGSLIISLVFAFI